MIYQFSQKIHYLLRSNLNELYFVHALRSFALSMISVFIPIFLLIEGFCFEQVLVFFLLNSLFVFVFLKKILEFAAKKGAKHVIILSLPLLISLFLGLNKLHLLTSFLGMWPSLVILSFFYKISSLAYFSGFHLDFAKVHQKGKTAKEISIMHTASIVFSILGPIFGAFIISVGSFQTLFLVVIVVLLVSIIPLFFSKEIHEPLKVEDYKIFTKKAFGENKQYFGEGLRNTAAAAFWPILLFVLAIDLTQIGWLYTFTHGVVALTTIIMGKYSTDKNQRKFLSAGTYIHGFSLFVRTFLSTISTIAVAQGVGAISFAMIKNPYFAIHYDKLQDKGAIKTIAAREFFLHIASFLLGVFCLVLYFITGNIRSSLIICIIIGGLFTYLMNKI